MARVGLAIWQAPEALAASTHQTVRAAIGDRRAAVSRAISLGVMGGVLLASLMGAGVKGQHGICIEPPLATTHEGLPAGRPCPTRQSRIQPDDFRKD
jgi:hypothetical protein